MGPCLFLWTASLSPPSPPLPSLRHSWRPCLRDVYQGNDRWEPCTPRLEICQGTPGRSRGRSALLYHVTFPVEEDTDTVQVPTDLLIEGDMVIVMQLIGADGAPLAVLFRYAFHTAFTRVDCEGTYPVRRVKWQDVDSSVKDENVDTEGFFMEMVFSDLVEGQGRAGDEPRGCPASNAWPDHYLTSALRGDCELQTHRRALAPSPPRGTARALSSPLRALVHARRACVKHPPAVVRRPAARGQRFSSLRTNPQVWSELERRLEGLKAALQPEAKWGGMQACQHSALVF